MLKLFLFSVEFFISQYNLYFSNLAEDFLIHTELWYWEYLGRTKYKLN